MTAHHQGEGSIPFPPVPGDPGVILTSRVISRDENERRGSVAGHAAFDGRFWLIMGSTALVVLPLVLFLFLLLPRRRRSRSTTPEEAIGDYFVPFLIGSEIFLILVVGLGMIMAIRAARSVANNDLAADGTLAIAWNREGFTVGGGREWRSYRYSQLRWVRVDPQARLAVLRIAGGSDGWAPPYLALPLDLVPPQAVGEFTRRGVLRPPSNQTARPRG